MHDEDDAGLNRLDRLLGDALQRQAGQDELMAVLRYKLGLRTPSSEDLSLRPPLQGKPAILPEYDPQRRRFLRAIGVSALAAATGDIERVAWSLRGRGPIHSLALDDLEARTMELERQCWLVPPKSLVPAVLGHLELIDSLGFGYGGWASHPSRLAGLAGRSTALAGWLCFLLENYGDAHTYCSLSEELANNVGDGLLRAHTLIIRAALYCPVTHGGVGGHAGTALAIQDAADAAIGKSNHPHLRAWLHACRAENYAAIGARTASLRDLDAAERFLALARSQPPGPGYWASWNSDRLEGFKGSCFLLMKDFTAATTTLAGAEKQTPEPMTERPAVLIDLAAAYAQQGEVEQACALLEEATTVAGHIGHAGHLQRVLGARQHLASWSTHPLVRDLDELIAMHI